MRRILFVTFMAVLAVSVVAHGSAWAGATVKVTREENKPDPAEIKVGEEVAFITTEPGWKTWWHTRGWCRACWLYRDCGLLPADGTHRARPRCAAVLAGPGVRAAGSLDGIVLKRAMSLRGPSGTDIAPAAVEQVTGAATTVKRSWSFPRRPARLRYGSS